MWLERPQKTRKFGSMCPWIRSVIASNLARAERRDASVTTPEGTRN